MPLRIKIVLAILTSAVVAIACVGAPLYLGAQRLIEEAADHELDQLSSRVDTVLDSQVQVAKSITSMIATMPRVQRGVSSQDRKGLLRLFSKDFSTFSADTGIAQFQFHTPESHSLLRVHNPDKHGDDLSGFRKMVVDANRDHRPLAGLERGRAGLGIRAIHPIEARGDHAGTVEIGLKLDETTLAAMVDGTAAALELYIFPDETIENFDATHAEVTRIATGLDTEPLLSNVELRAAIETDERGNLVLNDVTYATAVKVVNDYTGTPVAIAHILLPNTEYLVIHGNITALAAGAAILALVLAGLMAWLFGRRLTTHLAHVIKQMQALTHGQLDIETTALKAQGHEIAELATGLEAFRDGLQDAKDMRKDEQRRQAEQEMLVSRLAEGLNKIAHGDLDAHISADLGESYNRLIDDFNRAVLQLSDLITDISSTSASVNASAEQIGSAADDLSRRTETAAATLEQTAAALQEITTAVADSTEIIDSANASGSDAINRASEGSNVVGAAVGAIRDIEESSREIAQIIDVIGDIAFQTNLLALNAGVEAARAGESGSGFAVVAAEVRALAQRTAEAAQRIGGLITASGEKVQHGVDLVGQTGSALDQIVSSITRVTSEIERISALSRQQSQSLMEINSAVSNLDTVTQQNAGMFAETSNASASLRTEGHRLGTLVGRFSQRSNADSVQDSRDTDAPMSHPISA